MPDAIEQAKASFGRWNTAFNARDMEGMVAEMHFPHRRLSGDNEFQVWRTEADFRATRGAMRRHPSRRKNGITQPRHPSTLCNQAQTKCIWR